ncbi:hypothetical protein LAZ67_10004091 [Cordylochernes scorpioides]|uniref:Uncharacterized protein n=1 Tax=Cordylochernes scorpioides TaxID=51811 RepID=A0ABY6KY34_9ARAC|nr:hypothetical protein LAZ67_10004091 [Cordylochernes scorpioides]
MEFLYSLFSIAIQWESLGSNVTRAQGPPQPYNFDYNIQDEQGNTQYRQESGDQSGTVRGTYGYTDTNGVFRVVEYVADAGGFRATVRTNEPGTGPESPADVMMNVQAPPAGLQESYTRSGGYGGSSGGYGGSAGGAGGYGGSAGGAGGYGGAAGGAGGAGGYGGAAGGAGGAGAGGYGGAAGGAGGAGGYGGAMGGGAGGYGGAAGGRGGSAGGRYSGGRGGAY